MSTKPLIRFFTVRQVAEMLAVSTRSIRRWISDGELLAHKFGRQVRISEIDLRDFVAGRRGENL
jgi:excisionase family DNA binding protein